MFLNGKKDGNSKRTQKQAAPKNLKIQNESLDKQFHESLKRKQNSKNQFLLNHKHQTVSKNQPIKQKNKRKSQKNHILNFSSLAVILPQKNQQQNFTKQKRKSLMGLEASNINIDNGRVIRQGQVKITKNNPKIKQTSQMKIFKQNNQNLNILSHKKDKRNDRMQQCQRKKHLSCASILQGNEKNKSKSKSKSKDNKKQKKKHSYKFGKINLNDKQNQIKNRQVDLVGSIEKQFKSLNKKIGNQLLKKCKKSNASYDKDLLNKQIFQKHYFKIQNKQNRDPIKRLWKASNPHNFASQLFQQQFLIKKQPTYNNQKFTQKSENKAKVSKKSSKLMLQNRQIYFYIRKDITPSSSKRQFPVDKYYQMNRPKQIQVKRKSFKKTAQRSRKRASLNERSLNSHRQSLSIKNHYCFPNENKIQNQKKKKVKQSLKQKIQTYTSCLYLWAQELPTKQDNLRKMSQSLSDQDFAYSREQKQQLCKQSKYKNTTPKQHKINNQDDKQTVIKHKNNISQQQGQPKFFQAKKQRVGLPEQNQSQLAFKIEQSQNFSKSLNIDEIKYYESLSRSNDYNQSQSEFKNPGINDKKQAQGNIQHLKPFNKHFLMRQRIAFQLREQYPLLKTIQLQFLASICFIQRKWKQTRVARKVKAPIAIKDTPKIFKKNKNIFFKANSLDQVEKKPVHLITSEGIFKSQVSNMATHNQNTQTQQFVSLQAREDANQLLSKEQHQFQHQNVKLPQSFERQNLNRKKEQKNQGQIQTIQSPVLKSDVRNYYYFQEQDIFPDVSYLKTKRQLQKARFLLNLSTIKQQYKNYQISLQQFQRSKQLLESSYKRALRQFNSTKKAIKKGYLKYIQTINTINKILIKDYKLQQQQRIIKSSSHQRLLKRVNSEQSVIADIYRKIFKIDQLGSENGSEVSGQTKRLNQMLLIRKIGQDDTSGPVKTRNFKRFSGVGLNIGTYQSEILSQRNSIKLKTDQDQLKIKMLSSRETKSMQIGELVERKKRQLNPTTYKQDGIDSLEPQIYQQFQAGFQLNKQKSSQYYQQPQKICAISQLLSERQESQASKQRQTYNLDRSIKFAVNYENYGNLVLSQCYDENEQKYPFGKGSGTTDKKQAQMDQEILQSFKIQDNQDQIDGFYLCLDEHLDQQKEQMPGYDCPISRIAVGTCTNAMAKQYIDKFLQFLTRQKRWQIVIQQNLNKAQGFSPISYLRFVRQYQLPQDLYTPIIPNGAFQQFEDVIFRNEGRLVDPSSPQVQHPTQNPKDIYHRCLYQLLNSQLQEYRLFGQKGRPFPWETTYTCNQGQKIHKMHTPAIFSRCKQKIMKNVLDLHCGIILQNHPDVLDQDQLQQLHDRNQDSVIDMLQAELKAEKNLWYQLEEHSLQTTFDITELVWDQLIHQLAQDYAKLDSAHPLTVCKDQRRILQ